ncbi:MAG: transglycosylase SLT domain-containing protein [Candidatus Latescibacteria bacterium]|nr:transglycosylase SLT domain-containing protein [Candidatus Latescibacterota bacterium]NIM21357.1 transglycosylase SLT domain-containing protein [Candidatus Latescibacterota bacterium]NIM65538.1 transglycosylase SLT domain-containing protein [Candidatus Latescibacterota bacterium]NIO01918.1 transglycosylase SLT domain-containing protein [Candidatus Latescibacterota bacterium]NIO28731.1 transglycosylase SLT domain-containing protein [Candidatus Latescibacterota bacterium]
MSRLVLCLFMCFVLTAPAGKTNPSDQPDNEAGTISTLLWPNDPSIEAQENPAYLLPQYNETGKAYDLLVRGVNGGGGGSRLLVLEARLLTQLGLYERADSALNRLSAGETLGWGGLLGLWRARLSLLAGKDDNALEHHKTIGPELRVVFGPYQDYITLASLLGSGRNEEAFALGREILRDGRTGPLDTEFWEILLDAYISSDSLREAAEIASRLPKRLLAPEDAARIGAKEIDLLYQLGDTLEARAKTRSLAEKCPRETMAAKAVRWAIERLPLARLSTKELLSYSELMIDENQLSEGRKLLSHLRKRRLKRSDLDRQRILLAEMYYREKKYSQAAGLARLKYVSASLKQRSMLMLARCYRQLGRQVSAASLYENYASVYPSDAKAPEALFVAAELYAKNNYITKSIRTLERLSKTYRSHYFGRLSTLKLSWHHLDRGRHAKSVSILERSLGWSRRKDETTLYYLADAYGKMGKSTKRDEALGALLSLDSTSFYLQPSIESISIRPLLSSSGVIEMEGNSGLLAFLKEATEKKFAAQRRIRAALPKPRGKKRYEKARIHIERGRAFLEMGFRDWAETEFTYVEAILKPSKRLTFELAAFYDRYGLSWRSVKLYQRVWDSVHGDNRRTLSGAFARLLHPLLYPIQVFENCTRQGLDPHLVYAMIREESKFDLMAVSRAGAQGLMQLMPGTGKDVARRLDLPDEVGENLFAPEVNLAFGVWYSSYLLRRCGNDPLMMLCAYNAGLSNARRWFNARTRKHDVRRIVDEIAFRETRNYVKRIVESAHLYRSLYFDTGGAYRAAER